MYKITSSEERNEKATEFETKSMLYMMNYYDKSDIVYWYVIDFFNDVTGVDKLQTECYDIQSKGVKNIQPTQLGRYMVTLFKNFISEFKFADFILFIDSVSSTIDKELSGKITFKVADLPNSISASIKYGLTDEALSKPCIEDKTKITDKNIEEFMEKITIVIDSHSKEEYIKDAVELSSSVIVDDLYLRKIFKEIRDKQSSKKNNNCEGKLLSSIGCFYQYDKYIKKEEIQDLILSRICFNSALTNLREIPPAFVEIAASIDETIREEEIEGYQNDIFRLLYDKNNKKAYWELFSNVLKLIKINPTDTLDELYDKLDKKLVDNVHHLNTLSCKYYIALVRRGCK